MCVGGGLAISCLFWVIRGILRVWGACGSLTVQTIYPPQKLSCGCQTHHQVFGSIRYPVKAVRRLTPAFNVLVSEFLWVLIFKTCGIRRIVFTFSLRMIWGDGISERSPGFCLKVFTLWRDVALLREVQINAEFFASIKKLFASRLNIML